MSHICSVSKYMSPCVVDVLKVKVVVPVLDSPSTVRVVPRSFDSILGYIRNINDSRSYCVLDDCLKRRECKELCSRYCIALFQQAWAG